MENVRLALVAALVLAALHLLAGRLRFLDGVPRSWGLSVAGGISVAYVFVHLLPELNAAQEAVGEAAGGALAALESHVYLLALLGLAVFYGLERGSRQSRRERHETEGVDEASPALAWLAIGSYALYNTIIGYLLVHREENTARALLLFAAAMGVHFVINDRGLREHHAGLYHRYGRWLCAAAVLLGWAVGAATEISEAFLGLLLAFLAGGVILNVLKEELPAERESRFSAFLAGAAGYTLVLLAL
ncbi:MAG: hypothetical protein H0V19_07450 [Euzebyales bacterium]|nr:hypothetical protein [Euzebyales bacterium]MBA3621415.1 hypothetical protein [Euzebyales bacterium]